MPRLQGYEQDDPSGRIMVGENKISDIQDELEQRYDLHYVGNGSDKVYILLMIRRYDMKKGEIKYIVASLYGRRGQSPQVSTKEFEDRANASLFVSQTKADKVRKGYTLTHSEIGNKPDQHFERTKKIAPYKQLIPLTEELQVIEFMTLLSDDEYVLEEFNECDRMVYLVVSGNKSWSIYTSDLQSYESTGRQSKMDILASNRYKDSVFYGYVREDGSYSICEALAITGTGDLSKRTWKERRAMMSAVFEELYPGVDCYSRSYKFHLNEYYYDDKVKAYKALASTDVDLHLRHIEAHLSNPWVTAQQ